VGTDASLVQGSAATAEGEGMKVGLRILLALASIPIAALIASYAASFTGGPLGRGKEGTPNTVTVLFAVFVFSLSLFLVIGNILISRYFRGRSK
jgi:hypothetical protein